MKHIKGLDTLRAFAVFFVVMGHFGFWFDTTSFTGKVFKFLIIPDGSFGVVLFFVLSGFLITSILLNAKEHSENIKAVSIIKSFFIRRVLRIFPIYYLLLFILYISNYPDARHYFGYFATYTSNILAYRTNGGNSLSHTWTLSVEEQFYLIWPWLIVMVKDKYIKYVLFGSVLLGIVSTYIVMRVQHKWGPLLVINCFDSFGIGGIYAWVRLSDERLKKFERGLKIILVFALVIYFYWRVGEMVGYYRRWLYLPKTMYSIISIWLITLVINNRSKFIGKYFLENKILNYIGKISYGIYLYHMPYMFSLRQPIDIFINNATLPYPSINSMMHSLHLDYWINILLVITIAAISYRFIEKPILSFKNKFNYKKKANEVITPLDHIA